MAKTETKTVMTLTFAPDPAAEKMESKNYDIVPRTGNDDKRCPLLIGSNGRLYIAKGVIDPKKIKSISLQVVVETT